MGILTRLVTALLPLALTPLLMFAIADGYLNFGSGEKDLFMLLPWMLWSLVFALSAFVLWWRRWPHRRALVRSAWMGLAALGVAGGALVAIVSLGVAGR